MSDNQLTIRGVAFSRLALLNLRSKIGAALGVPDVVTRDVSTEVSVMDTYSLTGIEQFE